ncbi:MAG: PEP-CTERM sorting domain-containing protein [Phycisphaeraceae bacterium]|nr:PEP-CTERM sorting domain-containing protein [Phycisphaeraceae bacterium]
MKRTSLTVGLAGVGLLASGAIAGPWTVPAGETTNFFYENGGDANGLFGDPVVTPGGTFIFSPHNFRAQVAGVGVDTVTDQLFFDIIAKPGFDITGVRISEVGDYSIAGSAEVSIGGGLIITNLDVFGIATDTLTSSPGSPISTPASGEIWTAEAFGDLSSKVPAWRYIRIQLDNTLIARAFDAVSTALVEKKGVGAGIEIEIIPAPGSLGLLAIGGLFAARRRR